MKLIKSLGMPFLIAALVSAMVSFAITKINNPTVKIVDLGKVLNAQIMMGMRAAESNITNEPWMASIEDATDQVAEAIAKVAGKNTLVIVSPAVVQGAQDITREVLIELGLPTNLPKYDIKQEDLFPNEPVDFLPKEEGENNDWLMP